jgi:hypothetical protein
VVVTYLGLLLTFGAMFPPLALCLTVSILSISYFTKLRIGRYLTNTYLALALQPAVVSTLPNEAGPFNGSGSANVSFSSSQDLDVVSSRRDRDDANSKINVNVYNDQGVFVNAAGSSVVLRMSEFVKKDTLLMLLVLSCLFYTLFLFDTLGDQVGFMGAFWVLIVVPLLPALLLWGAASASKKQQQPHGKEQNRRWWRWRWRFSIFNSPAGAEIQSCVSPAAADLSLLEMKTFASSLPPQPPNSAVLNVLHVQ